MTLPIWPTSRFRPAGHSPQASSFQSIYRVQWYERMNGNGNGNGNGNVIFYVSYGVLTEFLRMNVILTYFWNGNGWTARIREHGNQALGLLIRDRLVVGIRDELTVGVCSSERKLKSLKYCLTALISFVSKTVQQSPDIALCTVLTRATCHHENGRRTNTIIVDLLSSHDSNDNC